jgi:hypothetical protein
MIGSYRKNQQKAPRMRGFSSHAVKALRLLARGRLLGGGGRLGSGRLCNGSTGDNVNVRTSIAIAGTVDLAATGAAIALAHGKLLDSENEEERPAIVSAAA